MTTILLIIAAGLLILNLILFFDVRAHDRRLGELGNSAARADERINARLVNLDRRLTDTEEDDFEVKNYGITNEARIDTLDETLESNARDIEALRAEVFSGSALIDNMAANNSETRKMVVGLREKVNDVEESMTLLAHEATVDRDRIFTMSNKLDAISRGLTSFSSREVEDTINAFAGKLDKHDFLLLGVAERMQGLNELEERVKLLKDNFDQERSHSDDVADELQATVRNLLKELPTIHACQRSLWARIYPLEKRVTAVEGQPELTLRESRPDGVATTIYKTDGTVITTYPNGTVVTDRPCKDDKVNDKVYSVWDDRPEAPKGKTSRPFIDVVPTDQNLGYIQNHHIVQDATGTQIPPRIARTANGKLAIRIYTDGATQ